MNYDELRALREEQRTPEFKETYRRRTRVEHRIGRMVQLGARQARYFGRAKVAYQVSMIATVANLMVAMGALSRALRGAGDALGSVLAAVVAPLIEFSRAAFGRRDFAPAALQVGRYRRIRPGMAPSRPVL